MTIFRCDNPRCGLGLPAEHAILIMGSVARRYCDGECVTDGYAVDMQRVLDETHTMYEPERDGEDPDWLG